MAVRTGREVAPGRSPADQRRANKAVYLVLTASFVVNADVTIVAVAAPAIERGLRASLSQVEMMVAVYQIAYAAVLITGGRLGDIYGRRAMFIAGFASFAVTSAACGLAATASQLIVFRLLQGVSGALLAPQVLATIQIVLPPQQRTRAYAAQGVVLALAAMVGPALAGLLISANLSGLGWRPVFLINLPIGLVAVVMSRRLIPEQRSPEAKTLDIPGTLIVFVALAAVMAAMSMGELYHWPAWSWLCLAASPVLAWVFMWSQRTQERQGRSPLLPTDLWRDKAFRLGLLLYVLLFSGVGTFYIYYFFLLQDGYHIPIWWGGLSTMPIGIGTVITSVASVRLARKHGARRVVAIGSAVAAAGFASMLIPVAVVRGGGVTGWEMPPQLLAGLGIGLLLAPLLSVVLAGIRSAAAGAAAGLLTTAQMIGRALGVLATGLLFLVPLPRAGTATIGQLTTGIRYALIYDPVVLAFSLLFVMRLPRPGAPEERASDHA